MIKGMSHFISYAVGDVTGDGVHDYIYLTGRRTGDSPFTEDITLHIQDSRTGWIQSVKLPEDTGYDPTIYLGDFLGNGLSQILITIPTGGSGGMINAFIYSSLHHQLQLLFDSNVYNETYKYEVVFQDNYVVKVFSLSNHQRYNIDISSRPEDYLSEIYTEDGKLIEPISGFVNPLSGLYPVDFNNDGVFELLAYQKIAGRYNADSLGYVQNTLGWKDGRFHLVNQNVAIFGY